MQKQGPFLLGISAYYHDSAAALLVGGKIFAAAQEERFTRKKHDSRFPANAIAYCLKEAGITLKDVDFITFYDKPLLKFDRLLETYLAYAPRGFQSFLMAMPIWLKEKLFFKEMLRRELSELSGLKPKELPALLFSEHHQSHAASAFFPSPYEKAAVLCLDGVGEWATTTAWLGSGNSLTPLWEIDFPHSLGMLYSAFTYYTGFKVNSGEYKLMGLAPYGVPKYVDLIKNHLMDLKPDGTFRLEMSYFNYATGLTMTNSKFDRLFGGRRRKPESEITQREMDLAASIQSVTEEVILKLGETLFKETGCENLCLAGGVALNCVANGRLLREGPFQGIWIQPAAGDAGGALGAALSTWHQYLNHPRSDSSKEFDQMRGSYLGPSFSKEEIQESLDRLGAIYSYQEDSALFEELSQLLSEGNVVGWFNGKMEYGPRALGGRSILGDPRDQEMQTVMNLKIKYRESFRPFAPAILAEEVSNYFEDQTASPYMLMVAPIKKNLRLEIEERDKELSGIERLKVPRSKLPAITHVDYSARIQTVHEETNPRFYGLLKNFYKKTGCPVLVNTSFNVRGEPIVCTPGDAYQCFMRTEMDVLVIDQFILKKSEQSQEEVIRYRGSAWQKEFELD